MTSNWFTQIVDDTTDASGRASDRIRLGTLAGSGGVLVSVPALGLQVTAPYTIQPGAPAGLVSAPQDTAIFTGRSFGLRASVVDRFSNPLKDAVTFSVISGPLTVNSSSKTLTASAVGQGAIVAQAHGRSDTMYVRVVPQGTIAGYTLKRNSADELAIYAVGLDGSHWIKLVSTVVDSYYNGQMPSAWIADGKQLVFHDNSYDHTKQLYVYDFASRRRFLAPTERLPDESWPRHSHNSPWVYFTSDLFGAPAVYRARTDGTAREALTPRGRGAHATPAPDGKRIAYINGANRGATLQVMDLETRAVSDLGIAAATPQWAPSGSEIAYIATGDAFLAIGELRAVKPDGTGVRSLTRNATRFRAHFDYSPDGKYIIAVTERDVLTSVVLATGEEIPVRIPRLAHGLLAPVWKP
jgi:hypothetical protein